MSFASLIARIENYLSPRSPKERYIVFAIVIVTGTILSQNLLLSPISSKQNQLRNDITNTEKQIAALNKALSTSGANENANGKPAAMTKANSLSQQLDVAQTQLEDASQSLVGATQMTDVLSAMLTLQPKIRLVELRNFPADPLPVTNKIEDEQKKEVKKEELEGEEAKLVTTPLYKHTMRLTLEGEYLNIVRYLDSIEKLPWKIFWQEFNLEVDQHPKTRVTLEFYTISPDDSWYRVT